MLQEYYTILARTIAHARREPAQLRALIYQLARVELRQELFNNGSGVSLTEAKEQLCALETAIERVETTAQGSSLLSSDQPNADAAAVHDDENAVVIAEDSAQLAVRQTYTPEVLPPLTSSPPLLAVERERRPVKGDAEGRVWPIRPSTATSWSTLQLFIVAILAVAIFSALQQGGGWIDSVGWRSHSALAPGRDSSSPVNQPPTSAVTHASSALAPSTAANSAGLPLPSFFGVYALAQGRLTSLGALPIAVPDPRVQISALIATPSTTTLPDGRLQFIAFRSDLAAGAPDHTTVRVVARVMHALTFDKAGHAKTVEVRGSWAVRGIAYQMRIAPVRGRQDMILIQPADPHFTFPAGRYALLLKNTAYDFSIAGPITDPAQCLERTDAVDEPFYNECRNPTHPADTPR